MPAKRRRPDTLFWLGRSAEVGDEVTLDADEAHHARVFRVAVGDVIELADGVGGCLSGIVVEDSRSRFRVAIDGVRASDAEPSVPLLLGFPPLRSGRTETLLEKATELGVTEFVPLRTERGRSSEGKSARWERVIRAAAMQCGRCRLPIVTPETGLEVWLTSLGPDLSRWAARRGGDARPRGAGRGAAALVGPEGDLTPEEWEAVDAAGFEAVAIGPRRLRAETAAIALLALLSAP